MIQTTIAVKNNIFNSETTDSIMKQQIYFITDFQILVLEVVIKEEERHTQFYTGLLNKSYIQSHLTSRWISLKTKQSLQATQFLNPSTTKNTG